MLDLSATLAGAVVSGVLADYGAEVTLVEPPGGSPLRAQAAWPYWGRSKRSVVLDLHDADDLERTRALARASDVVVETWRSGVAEARGLGWEDLAAHNPRVVLASISAFGRHDPELARIPGWEPIVMAKVGGSSSFATLTARPGPAFVSTPYCSVSAAHLCLHGVLAALLERETSGRGQHVEATLAQGVAAHDPWNWLMHVLARRYESAFMSTPFVDEERLVPNSPYFVRLLVGLTADGRWLQFSQSADKLWEAFVEALGLSWTRDDPVLHDGPASEDPEVRVRFWELALGAVRSKTHAEWLASFDEHPDVWAEVFRSGDELLDHPQLVHDGRVLEQDGVRQPGALADLSATPATFDRPPDLDEHGGGAREEAAGHLAAPPTRTPAASGPTTPPLDGITVVELGTWFAGPFGATRLAELGARVIKIEPLTGDPIRHAIPFPELAGVKVTAGKESVALDLGTDAGRAAALALVERADLVLQSYRAGVADRLGLGRAEMLAANPDLVLVEAPGYGSGGPCGHRPAFAPTMGAGSGLAYRGLGGRGAVPEGPDLTLEEVKRSAIRLSMAAMSVANADGFSALGVATASLLGLLAHRRHGVGQIITTSMLSTMAHALADSMVAPPGAEPAPVPDADLFGFGPRWRLYETADGWVFLAAPRSSDVAPLAKGLGIDEGDVDHPDRVAAAFRTRPAREWERDLLAADVACVEVADAGVDQTVMLGDLGRRLGFVVDSHHTVLEDHPRLGPLVSLSRSAAVLGPSPLCGDDTERVLAELGYEPGQLADLRAEGVLA